MKVGYHISVVISLEQTSKWVSDVLIFSTGHTRDN